MHSDGRFTTVPKPLLKTKRAWKVGRGIPLIAACLMGLDCLSIIFPKTFGWLGLYKPATFARIDRLWFLFAAIMFTIAFSIINEKDLVKRNFIPFFVFTCYFLNRNKAPRRDFVLLSACMYDCKFLCFHIVHNTQKL